MRASERRLDLGGEPPDALPSGLSAVKQDVLDADRAQGFEFRSDSVGRTVERARLGRARCVGISGDVRSIGPVEVVLDQEARIEPDGGAVFTVTLPIVQGAKRAGVPEEPATRA